MQTVFFAGFIGSRLLGDERADRERHARRPVPRLPPLRFAYSPGDQRFVAWSRMYGSASSSRTVTQSVGWTLRASFASAIASPEDANRLIPNGATLSSTTV